MSLTATFESDLARVQLSATSLGAGATYAVMERSLNGTRWFSVRGGTRLPVVSQAAQIDDFEFFADVQNFYRIRSFDDDDVLQETFTDDLTPMLTSIWLKSIRYPLLNRAVTVTDWSPVARGGRGTVHDVVGRSTPVATTELHRAPGFVLELMTATGAAAAVLDLVIAAGGVLFVHTPAGCAVPGGYVVVGDTARERRTRSAVSPRRYTSLPCQVVTPPAPQITGTLLTWGTVERLFGSWDALVAAAPTWRDLLATVGSPDDLVVI